MLATEAKLEDISTAVEVHQGAITITGNGDSKLYIDYPETKPLSGSETHAQLRIVENRFDVEIELDARQLDALADAIYHVQAELQADAGGMR